MKRFFTIMSVCVLMLCISFGLSACGDGSGGGGGGGGGGTNTAPSDTTVIMVGTTHEAYGITVTLDYVWVSTAGKYPNLLPAGNVYLFPHFTITNNNTAYQGLSTSSIERLAFSSIGGCVGHIGSTEYKRTLDDLMSYHGNKTLIKQMDISVNYGQTVKVFNAFHVPASWTTIEFTVNHMTPDSRVPTPLNFKYTVNK